MKILFIILMLLLTLIDEILNIPFNVFKAIKKDYIYLKKQFDKFN